MPRTPPSSVGHGPPSSPFGGTDLTLYSPDAVRKDGRCQASTVAGPSVIAMGKQPLAVPDVQISGIRYKGLQPQAGRPHIFVNELSSNDNNFISRYLFIQKIPDSLLAGTDHEMELYHIQHQMKQQYRVFSNAVPIYARGVHLRFDNLRDSCEAKQVLQIHDYNVSFIDNYDFALAKSQDTAAINEFEGQIMVAVQVEPAESERLSKQKLPAPVFTTQDIAWLSEAIERAMSQFGTVRTHCHVWTNPNDEELVFAFRIEFHSVEAAARAAASLKKDPMWDTSPDGAWRWSTVNAVHWDGPRSPNSPHRRLPRIDDKGRLMEFRHLPQVHPNDVASKHHPADAHNRVRRERILDGSDVRTTIMLRNIPSKLDFITLKALLDEVCYGCYDFIYLRIDFKSGHNVGYAFVNFNDVAGMIAMLDLVEGRGWKGYRSSKNAEISYATIQGREALVQKFRNSSVMQETPFCRPRLYTSYEDAVAANQLRECGVELPFPMPDNLSKLQRSMDSARSVGLFPPSGITNYNGQRLINSDFDRGGPRDLVHAANIYGRFGPTPMFAHIPDHKRRDCEQWYAINFGLSQAGIVAFENIPMTQVLKFMEMHGAPTKLKLNAPPTDAPTHPGVIGRPAPSGQGTEAPAFGGHASRPQPAVAPAYASLVSSHAAHGPVYGSHPPHDPAYGSHTPRRPAMRALVMDGVDGARGLTWAGPNGPFYGAAFVSQPSVGLPSGIPTTSGRASAGRPTSGGRVLGDYGGDRLGMAYNLNQHDNAPGFF